MSLYTRRIRRKPNSYDAIPRRLWRIQEPQRNGSWASSIDDPRFWVTRCEGKPLMWFHRKQAAQDYAFICSAKDPDRKYDVAGI